MTTINGTVAGIKISAELISTDADLRTLVDQLEAVALISLDIETTGYEGQSDYGPSSGVIRLCQIAWHDDSEMKVVVIDAEKVDLSIIRPLLESEDIAKLIHYSPFECKWFKHHLEIKIVGAVDTCYLGQSINKTLRGRVARALTDDLDDKDSLQRSLFKIADSYSLPSGREVSLVEVKKAYDSVEIPIKGWKLSERATLQAMVKRYLGHDLDKDGQTSDWSGELTDEQLVYAAGDAVVTLQIWPDVVKVAEQLDVYANMIRRVGYDEAKS